MEPPGLRRTRLHNLGKYEESEKEGIAGEKTKSRERETGGQGEREKMGALRSVREARVRQKLVLTGWWSHDY